MKTNGFDKLHKILQTEICSFLSSEFMEIDPKEEFIYVLPKPWQDNFHTFHFKYWTWIEDYREGSAICFHDKHYDRLYVFYIVD
jgi:hypothetical protein